MLRTSFAWGATFVAGVSIGAAGDATSVPLLVGVVAAGGALLFTAGPPGDRADTIDTLGRRELVRARRASRPVTVASVGLGGNRLHANLEVVADELAASIRETDLIGYGGGSRLLLLLTETSGAEAVAAWARLRAELEPSLAQRVSVGMASFPDDNTTWEGLKALAREREPKATTSEEADRSRRPHGATVPNEA